MKHLIPADARRTFRSATRWLQDIASGQRSQFAKPAPYFRDIPAVQKRREQESYPTKIHQSK